MYGVRVFRQGMRVPMMPDKCLRLAKLERVADMADQCCSTCCTATRGGEPCEEIRAQWAASSEGVADTCQLCDALAALEE